MKRHGLTAAVTLLMSGGAIAADLGAPALKTSPSAAAAYQWTGFYIGAHVGGAWGNNDFDLTSQNNILPPGLLSNDVSGPIAGGQMGFNWQLPGRNWVLGIETQASWSNADGERAIPVGTVAFGSGTKVEWLATVAGRVGYAFDRVLVYGKGGLAFARDDHEFFIVSGSGNRFSLFSDQTRSGWTVGGGIEVALGSNWSLTGEYSYMDFGTDNVKFTDPAGFAAYDVDQQIHAAKIGVNYRFGPSPTRY